MKVLLLSGLALRKQTSFYYQLRLLASFLPLQGIQAVLADSDSFHPTGFQAAILLGYPDQFPFLGEKPKAEIPFFFWTQCSRPPATRSFGPAVPVPITERSREFLFKAGFKQLPQPIPHGVDTAVYQPLGEAERCRIRSELGLEGYFVVGSVGAHTQRKKLDRVIASFAEFAGSEPTARLLIKTNRAVSPAGMDLNTLLEQKGLRPSARIVTENLSEHRLCKLYNAMDLYLHLAEWEGFGLPVIEAMACGIPVSTPPIQGPGETVPYKELRVPPGWREEVDGTELIQVEPATVAEVLSRARRDPNLLRRLSRRGLEAAKRLYDIRRIAAQWAGLIRNSPSE